MQKFGGQNIPAKISQNGVTKFSHADTTHTGKSVSEALILESVNPQYDERLFIEFPEKYKFTTCCVL